MDITNLSSLPTDSLYKFMSLFGALVAIASVVLPEFVKKSFKFQLLELRKDLDIHKINCRYIDEIVERLRKDASRTEEKFIKIAENGGDLGDEERKEVVRLRRATDELNEKSQDISRITCIMECETRKVTYLSEKLFLIGFLQSVGFFMGAALCGSGFYLWYFRLQIYVDAALKMQGA